jgi:hypothetical protein
MLELCFLKVIRIHSAPYIEVLIFQLRIAWELFSDIHGSCLCVGNHEVALVLITKNVQFIYFSMKYRGAESISGFTVGRKFLIIPI